MKTQLLSLKNTVDFKLRSLFKWGKEISPEEAPPGIDIRVQNEFNEFLKLFPWKKITQRFKSDTQLLIGDIGARNFCFGPVIDNHFQSLQLKTLIHGVEIDAYRRLSNFHTRYDFGKYYARRCRNAEFHPIDFLAWNENADILFLLNPFVSEEPTVLWGLPLSQLKPQTFFDHAYNRLKEKKGIAVLSCPSVEEYEIALGFAQKAGFTISEEEVVWRPTQTTQQRKPRYGVVLLT